MENSTTQRAGVAPAANCSTFWLTARGHFRTRPVKVTRFTEKSVWVWREGAKMERKELRHTQWNDYWPTKEEAEANIRTRAESMIAHCEERLAEARAALAALSSNDLAQTRRAGD